MSRPLRNKKNTILGDHETYFGPYEVVTPIASGGMASVFLCRKRGPGGFNRLFALKAIHPYLAVERHFVRMFLDEARLAAKLHHPNVVGILDVGETRSRHFVVMDYIEGGSLSELSGYPLQEHRIPRLILTIALDVLRGLDAAHNLRDEEGKHLRVVHRDLSPQNILVGIDGMARITDFGIAKAESRLAKTRTGVRKGKFQYMAPEHVNGERNIGPRADIFSLGVVLWNSLTGKRLFRGNNEAATLNNVLTKDVPPPSQFCGALPPSVDSIILRALERSPRDRFESAMEMSDALHAVMSREGLIATTREVSGWVSQACGAKMEERRFALSSSRSKTFLFDLRNLLTSPFLNWKSNLSSIAKRKEQNSSDNTLDMNSLSSSLSTLDGPSRDETSGVRSSVSFSDPSLIQVDIEQTKRTRPSFASVLGKSSGATPWLVTALGVGLITGAIGLGWYTQKPEEKRTRRTDFVSKVAKNVDAEPTVDDYFEAPMIPDDTAEPLEEELGTENVSFVAGAEAKELVITTDASTNTNSTSTVVDPVDEKRKRRARRARRRARAKQRRKRQEEQKVSTTVEPNPYLEK